MLAPNRPGMSMLPARAPPKRKCPAGTGVAGYIRGGGIGKQPEAPSTRQSAAMLAPGTPRVPVPLMARRLPRIT